MRPAMQDVHPKYPSKNRITMKYPIGIQTFETIREDGYVYVD